MILIDRDVVCNGRADVFEISPIYDIHLGSRNCAEKPLRKRVAEIAHNPNILWFGGGDLLDCIKPQDSKRFDMDTLPDWMLEGDAVTTRENLNDILVQQYNRLISILEPIASQCIGLIEGNHEHSIRKYHNENIQKALCNKLNVVNLTDEFLVRLRFRRKAAGATVIIYGRHGYGGGRTPGTEPNKLARMIDEWEIADICFSGHSHTFNISPPKPILEIPRSGKLPSELTQRYRWAANPGCYLYSHSVGPSTYASRACYPARPMLTVKAEIKPFAQKMRKGEKVSYSHIELRGITL